MNTLIITGNLGRDANIKSVSGSTVANFSVAAKAGYGEREQTIWVDCALWGKRAESRLVDYLKKGQMVCVSGEMGTREHDGKTYITMRVENVTLCGGRNGSGGQNQGYAPQQPQRSAQAPQHNAPMTSTPLDDDVPF